VLALVALFSWTANASAHCRTTTLSGDNQTCVKDGLPLFWRPSCVTMTLNDAPTRIGTQTQMLTLMQDTFSTWSDLACSTSGKPSITLSASGTTSQKFVGFDNAKNAVNQNVVIFHDGTWPYGDAQQLALTTLTFQKTNGEIVDADLEINSTRDLYFGGSLPPNGFDLETILAHESGHILGLAHSVAPGATMLATYEPGSTTQRNQKPDDIEGLCEVYPPNATRATAGGAIGAGPCVAPPPDKGCGCTTHGDSPAANWARALPFLLVLLSRVRRRSRA
jgi:MYXO-CTERM domain-containing protein